LILDIIKTSYFDDALIQDIKLLELLILNGRWPESGGIIGLFYVKIRSYVKY